MNAVGGQTKLARAGSAGFARTTFANLRLVVERALENRATLVWLTVLALLVRAVRMGVPAEYTYDEIYYAYTSERITLGDPNVYDPYAVAPDEGFFYAWVNPPLGQLLTALVIRLIGSGLVAWRLVSVLAGAALVPATAFLARRAGLAKKSATLAAMFVAVEGLSLSISRVGIPESLNVLFITLFFGAWFAWSEKKTAKWAAACGALLGLALATKWSVLFFGPALFLHVVLRLRGERARGKMAAHLALIGGMAGAIYVAAYAHFFARGYSLHAWGELQSLMLNYHQTLRVDHPFASGPANWMVGKGSIPFRTEELGDGGFIYSVMMANPIFMVLGLAALVVCVVRDPARSWRITSLYVAYVAVFLLPGRPAFLYYQAALVPLLAIAVCMAFDSFRRAANVNATSNTNTNTNADARPSWTTWGRAAALGACGVWMVLAFPYLTSLPVSGRWDAALEKVPALFPVPRPARAAHPIETPRSISTPTIEVAKE